MKPIKWIFAYSQGSEAGYESLIRVAVASARARTSFQAVCFYDGEPTDLTRWLEFQGVQIVLCRTAFGVQLETLARTRNDESIVRIGRGAFLRFEIPRVAQELGWDDECVFYSDCDVMFECDPTPVLHSLKPQIFAVAPEHAPDSPLHMNSGAMWINLAALRRCIDGLNAWTKRHFARVWDSAWDQGALRVYFHPLHRALWRLGVPDRIGYGLMTRLPARGWKWDDLPVEFNWKPYWGENPGASIVHFHGPKPAQRGALDRGELPPHLSALGGAGFRAYAARWDEWLELACVT